MHAIICDDRFIVLRKVLVFHGLHGGFLCRSNIAIILSLAAVDPTLSKF